MESSSKIVTVFQKEEIKEPALFNPSDATTNKELS